MPREYKRKPGSRKYNDYDPENLEKALEKVVSGWPLTKAAKTYRIAYGTLYNKYKGLHIKKIGGQTVLTLAEEKAILKCVVTCSDWGFPLNVCDIQHITKNFLDRRGRTESKFKDNLPSSEWVHSMLKRHSDMVTQRLAANIKRSRSEITKPILEEYFTNLRQTLEDIPPSHIFNYDETNLSDDPGRNKYVYRRGIKYPERIINFSKSATSVMFCGSALGVLLPPYVIYKSENIWDRWTENGPKGSPCCTERCCSGGSRYNRSKSGWIDSTVFTDWFRSTFLPHAMSLEGKKVIIGDNLSSHFTEEVLELCEQNNISFICLPPNSTHLTQPLDVSFFRPLKMAWRSIIQTWKIKNPKSSSIRKEIFPSLLKEALNKMNETRSSAIKEDLISGFEACGITPFNPNRVISKLPEEGHNIEADVSTVVIDYLKEKRYGNIPLRGPPKKKSRLTVTPGKSVNAAANESSESSDNDIGGEPLMESDDDPADNDDPSGEVDYLDVSASDLKEGCFLLVRIKSGRRSSMVYRYACIIQEKLQNGDCRVMGLASADEEKKTFRAVERDIFEVPSDDIIAVLPQPEVKKVGERLRYIFTKYVDVFEQ